MNQSEALLEDYNAREYPFLYQNTAFLSSEVYFPFFYWTSVTTKGNYFSARPINEENLEGISLRTRFSTSSAVIKKKKLIDKASKLYCDCQLSFLCLLMSKM